ncbi:hypothetical protein AB0J21_28925 [Streptomyces sp. NPDC049954]|uniref:hypothetical protein n=1 Tax=Streptomyces sp. NPDC049954 TaxID=3155779 RepID=UPI00343FFD24
MARLLVGPVHLPARQPGGGGGRELWGRAVQDAALEFAGHEVIVERAVRPGAVRAASGVLVRPPRTGHASGAARSAAYGFRTVLSPRTAPAP